MPKPQNLGMIEFIGLFSMITALTAVSIDALLPALRQIGLAMGHGNVAETQLIISLFIGGMMLGEIVFGPIADAIGRKATILIGLAIYALGSLIAMTANNFEWLLAGRIIQGIGASGPKIAARALIRDQFVGDQMARISSYIFMVFILVPMLAPAIGLVIAKLAGWRMIFTLFLVWALAVGSWLWFRQPETLPPERRIPIRPVTLLHNGLAILRHPKIMALTLGSGLMFGSIFVFVGLAQAIFSDVYQAGDAFVLWFALLASGIGLGSFLNGKLVVRFGTQRMAVSALSVMAITSSLQLLASILSDGSPAFWIFFFTTFLNFGCLSLLFGNLNAMAMQWLGQLAGLGAALIASLSSLVAVLMSIIVAQFYQSGITPLPVSFLLAAILTSICVWLAAKSQARDVVPAV